MVSVVIPAFQAEEHLPRLLASLDAEPDWTVVIVDDGSTDRTVAVAEDWLATRKTGRLIGLDHVGPGAARQIGLDAVDDDYVIFADADDEMVFPAMRHAADALEESGADVCIAHYEERPGRVERSALGEPESRLKASRHVLVDRAAIWGKVYRVDFLRSHLLGFPPLRSADDVFFSWRVASQHPQVIEWPEVGYLYWVDPHGQLTSETKYYQEGLTSLALLWRESRGGSLYSRSLAMYAYISGSWHIARRVSPDKLPRILSRAVAGIFKVPGPHG